MSKTAPDTPVLRALPARFFASPGVTPAPTPTGGAVPGSQSVASVALHELRSSCVPRSVLTPGGADGFNDPAPSAPSPSVPESEPRRLLLDELQARIRAIEHGGSAAKPPPARVASPVPRGAEEFGLPPETSPRLQPASSAPNPFPASRTTFLSPADAGTWTLGEPAFDAWLPEHGLNPAAVHELKPASYGDWPATLAFAACLASRRRQAGIEDGATRAGDARPMLWCSPTAFVAEHGGLHGAGLADLGFAPDVLIAVEARSATDTLWTLEEGLRSKALSLAIGVLREVDLTPSRRLGLAAAAARTPVLLLTLPATAAAPTAALRLRIRRRPSARHPFDPQAPGAPRFGLTLERCRRAAPECEGLSLELEWCDVAHRFRVVAGLADRADAAPGHRQRAGG